MGNMPSGVECDSPAGDGRERPSGAGYAAYPAGARLFWKSRGKSTRGPAGPLDSRGKIGASAQPLS